MFGFPNVPIAPGVPAIPRDPTALINIGIDLLVGDVLSLLGDFGSGGPVWGLFLNGAPAVVADTVVSFDYRESWALAKYPLEEGAFENYDKVQEPFDIRIRFSTGGSLSDRQELIESVNAAISSLELFDAVTPEAVYQSVNPVHQDYRRSGSQGAGLVTIDVFCQQVRVTATSAFTNSQQSSSAATPAAGAASPAAAASPNSPASFEDKFSAINNPQSPSASPQVNGGTVQPVAAAPSQFDLSQAMP